MASEIFIVTALLSSSLQCELDVMREKYFPPERNFLKAHLTLFHKLTAKNCDDLELVVKTTSLPCRDVSIDEPFLLGHGVGLKASSKTLVQVHRGIMDLCREDLSPQDLQPFRPHITIQNKVSVEKAKQTLIEVLREWSPKAGNVLGVEIWRYLGGPWDLHRRLEFPLEG